jgi:hypothetical protein
MSGEKPSVTESKLNNFTLLDIDRKRQTTCVISSTGMKIAKTTHQELGIGYNLKDWTEAVKDEKHKSFKVDRIWVEQIATLGGKTIEALTETKETIILFASGDIEPSPPEEFVPNSPLSAEAASECEAEFEIEEASEGEEDLEIEIRQTCIEKRKMKPLFKVLEMKRPATNSKESD